MANVKDPVCGMTVDTGNAAGRSSFGGETFYFCSEECQNVFEANPARYAAKASRSEASSPADIRSEPPHTKRDGIVAPKFGSAGSGGAEYEPPTTFDEAPRKR